MYLRGEKKLKKLKILIEFLSANKIDNYNRVGVKRKKKKKKKEKIQKDLQNKSKKVRIINVFLESLLSESFPKMGITVHLTFL